MAGQEHHYAVQVKWTGNRGKGTSGYRDYERDYTISTSGKADIAGSSDPAFRGDASRWNPEDLLVASLFLLPISSDLLAMFFWLAVIDLLLSVMNCP